MKKCTKCLTEKSETEFFKKRKSLESFCKVCRKQKHKERVLKNPEKYREKEKLRSEKRRETDEWKIWRKVHQEINRLKINEKSRIYWLGNDSVKEKAKLWKKSNIDRVKKSLRTWIEKNPMKKRAHSILNYHVSVGNMSRPKKCVKCFKECKPDAHHVDYTKPLDVLWLCRQCHRNEHIKK